MSHLTAFDFDELAAELPVMAPVQAHLGGCAECQARLASLRGEAAVLRALPRFESARAALDLAQPRPLDELEAPRSLASRRRVPTWASRGAIPLALAASLVLMVVTQREHRSPEGGDILKGAPALTVLRELGISPRAPLKAGERVMLSLEAGGHPYGLVMAREEDGTVMQLWPSSSAIRLASGANRLEPGFEVTPGAVLLYAFIADAPLDPAAARRALLDLGPPGQALSTLGIPAPLPKEKARARLLLDVQAPR